MGIRMLNTKIRAFSFVVHLIGELGGHITLPTLKKKSKIKIFIPVIVTRPGHGVNSRFLRDVTAAMLVYRTIVKKGLGIWGYYYAKLERHFASVLYTNMPVSSREWKPRIDLFSHKDQVRRSKIVCLQTTSTTILTFTDKRREIIARINWIKLHSKRIFSTPSQWSLLIPTLPPSKFFLQILTQHASYLDRTA